MKISIEQLQAGPGSHSAATERGKTEGAIAMTTEADHKISARDLLQAFSAIQQQGEPRDGHYVSGPLRADAGHDGYTVTISDDNVEATVGFHNSVRVTATSSRALKVFKERVVAVIRSG